MALLFTLITFMVVAAVVLSGYYAVTAESPATERLRRLVPEAAQPALAGRARKQRESGLLTRALAVLGQYSLGGEDTSLSHTLSVAGIRSRNAAALFVGTRLVLSVGPALVVLVFRISGGKPVGTSLAMAGVVWAYGHVLVNYWLKRRARNRVWLMEKALPDSLDLMVVCLEGGLGLNATVARVGEERSSLNDPLGAEFNQVARELREGRGRDECLRGLADRNGVEDLKSLATLIIQSDRLGASMAKTLRAHADVLRTKRRQRAEEAARKLPIKILFPLAFFILPSLLIVAIGPAMLGIQALMKLLAGG